MSHTILIIPCFNEAGRLDITAFERPLPGGRRIEYCFVDDGSFDATHSILMELTARAPHCSVIRLERNGGKAEAVRLGLLEAIRRSPDFIGFWDADLATPLTELPRFCEALENQPSLAAVLGSRVKLLGREIGRRPARHYLGRVGATLISVTLGVEVYDTQCGAKVFRNDSDLAAVFADPFISRWIFDVEIVARYRDRVGKESLGSKVVELPLNRWKDVGGSKIRSGDFVRALRDLRKIGEKYPRPNGRAR